MLAPSARSGFGKAIRGVGDAVDRSELLRDLSLDEEYFAAGVELGRKTVGEAIELSWFL